MKFSTMGWIAGVALVGAGFAIGIYPYLTGEAEFRQAIPSNPGAAKAVNGGWAVQETDDPMTDLHTVSASKVIQGERLLIDAAIKCTGGSDLTYEFGTFDTGKKAVEMASRPDAYSLKLMDKGLLPAGPVIRFQARLDANPAVMGLAINPRYANVLSIGMKSPGVNSADMASAERVLIRLPTRDGDETVEIDQTDSEILHVLHSCSAGNKASGMEESADEGGMTAIPELLLKMGYDDAGALQPGVVVLSAQDFSTVGSSVETEWLGKILQRGDNGITVGLQLVQPQMWYYAIVHHSCESPSGYSWQKFWNAEPDATEGTMAVGSAAAIRAKEESADDLGVAIFNRLCRS